MTQLRIPAVFMRGGTNKAIVFQEKDLPRERAEWDDIFLAAIGSPITGCWKAAGQPARWY
jgi:2-methylaconitate cis-trans-isomerase PrpF